MFQFINDAGSRLDIFFDRILIIKKVAPLNGVVHMLFPTVRLRISQRSGNTTLCGSRMGAGRIDLGQDSNIKLLAYLQGTTHSRKAGTDYHHIIFNHKNTSNRACLLIPVTARIKRFLSWRSGLTTNMKTIEKLRKT
jgi:hypothetical protein